VFINYWTEKCTVKHWKMFPPCSSRISPLFQAVWRAQIYDRLRTARPNNQPGGKAALNTTNMATFRYWDLSSVPVSRIPLLGKRNILPDCILSILRHRKQTFYVRLVLPRVSYELPTQNLPQNAHGFWNAYWMTDWLNYFDLPQCKKIRHYLIDVIILQDGTAQYFGSGARTINFATTLFASAHHLQPVLATSRLRKFILMLFECSGRIKNMLHQFTKQT